MSHAQGNDMTTEDSSQDKGHSESPSLPPNTGDTDRLLGDLRIFQAVFNDLKMTHEIVTLADGTKSYAYVYGGIDPYELGDNRFPTIQAAITKKLRAERLDELEKAVKHGVTVNAGMTGFRYYLDDRIKALQAEETS